MSSIPDQPFAERPHNCGRTSHNFQDCEILQQTGSEVYLLNLLAFISRFSIAYYTLNHKTFEIMNLAEKAEEMAEQKIYEEGGYPALWKYKTVRLFKKCGCM
jgi:hypothetical protein